MKALGKDINEFYNNHFPENSYIEGDEVWIENFISDEKGLCLVPTEKYELNAFGWIASEDTGKQRSFATVFKKWLNTQTTVTLAIEVPKEKEEEVRQKLKELGLKVI